MSDAKFVYTDELKERTLILASYGVPGPEIARVIGCNARSTVNNLIRVAKLVESDQLEEAKNVAISACKSIVPFEWACNCGGRMMYDELIKRLRNCATQAAPCKTCDMIEDGSCSDTLMKQAADAIEELLDFAHFVAKEVVVSDDEWENRQNAFPEIASLKLNKLGIVEKDGAFWSYEPQKEET